MDWASREGDIRSTGNGWKPAVNPSIRDAESLHPYCRNGCSVHTGAAYRSICLAPTE